MTEFKRKKPEVQVKLLLMNNIRIMNLMNDTKWKKDWDVTEMCHGKMTRKCDCSVTDMLMKHVNEMYN